MDASDHANRPLDTQPRDRVLVNRSPGQHRRNPKGCGAVPHTSGAPRRLGGEPCLTSSSNLDSCRPDRALPGRSWRASSGACVNARRVRVLAERIPCIADRLCRKSRRLQMLRHRTWTPPVPTSSSSTGSTYERSLPLRAVFEISDLLSAVMPSRGAAVRVGFASATAQIAGMFHQSRFNIVRSVACGMDTLPSAPPSQHCGRKPESDT